MEIIWFWIAVGLLLVAVFAWPTWPYARRRQWTYFPVITVLGLFLLLALLIWFGIVAIVYPWAA